MSGAFDTALLPFKVHLDEIRNCVAFVKESVRLKSSLGKIIDWKLGRTYEISLAESFLKLEALQQRPVFNGLFVTAIAAFEEFLRNIIILAARQKIGISKNFIELGQSFINRHIEYSGRLLATVNSPPAHLSVNYYDLCRRLGTCIPESQKIEINDIALSFIRGITDIGTFIDCIKSIGFQIEIDDLSRSQEMQKLLQTKKVRETTKELKESLKKTLQNRHKIAHSGQSYAEITEEIFNFHLRLLELTAEGIVTHLDKKTKT